MGQQTTVSHIHSRIPILKDTASTVSGESGGYLTDTIGHVTVYTASLALARWFNKDSHLYQTG